MPGTRCWPSTRTKLKCCSGLRARISRTADARRETKRCEFKSLWPPHDFVYTHKLGEQRAIAIRLDWQLSMQLDWKLSKEHSSPKNLVGEDCLNVNQRVHHLLCCASVWPTKKNRRTRTKCKYWKRGVPNKWLDSILRIFESIVFQKNFSHKTFLLNSSY